MPTCALTPAQREELANLLDAYQHARKALVAKLNDLRSGWGAELTSRSAVDAAFRTGALARGRIAVTQRWAEALAAVDAEIGDVVELTLPID